MIYYTTYFYVNKRGSFGFGYTVDRINDEMTLSMLNKLMEQVYKPEFMTDKPMVISWQILKEEE